MQPGFAVGEATLNAALTLRRVGAVEEGDVLVSDILEPVKEICQLCVLRVSGSISRCT